MLLVVRQEDVLLLTDDATRWLMDTPLAAPARERLLEIAGQGVIKVVYVGSDARRRLIAFNETWAEDVDYPAVVALTLSCTNTIHWN